VLEQGRLGGRREAVEAPVGLARQLVEEAARQGRMSSWRWRSGGTVRLITFSR